MADERRVWVVDTCGLLGLRDWVQRENRAAILERWAELAAEGTLIFPPQVLEEIEWGETDLPPNQTRREPTAFASWARKAKEDGARRAPDWEIVREVMRTVPEIVDADYERDQADPFVLALALQVMRAGNPVSLVTEERRRRPPGRMSLREACGAFDIPVTSTPLFVRRLGLGSLLRT